MKFSLLLAVALVAISIGVAIADDVEVTSTEATRQDTYMGVDANDAEAVKQKLDELNKEKWEQLFGDVDIDDIDFSPSFETNSIDSLKGSLNNLLTSLFEKVFRRKLSSTTEATV